MLNSPLWAYCVSGSANAFIVDPTRPAAALSESYAGISIESEFLPRLGPRSTPGLSSRFRFGSKGELHPMSRQVRFAPDSRDQSGLVLRLKTNRRVTNQRRC